MGFKGGMKASFSCALVLALFVHSPFARAEEAPSHAPKAGMIDNGDGTVTDNKTGLVWQKEDDEKERDWNEAGEYCKGLKLAGGSDWRLPDKKELVSLWWNAGFIEDVREKFFPTMKKNYYWTSTPYASAEIYGKKNVRAFSINFTEGRSVTDAQDSLNIVRCVRAK